MAATAHELRQELAQASNQQAKNLPQTTVRKFFEAKGKQIQASLPKHMNAERMTRLMLTCIQETPKLAECDMTTLFGALSKCSQIGLEPGIGMNHVYLIPFGRNVQVIPGYAGLIELACRHKDVISIKPVAVYENDDYDYQEGLEEKLFHRPTRGDRGEIIAVYAIAKLAGGVKEWRWMWIEDVEKIRQATAKRNKRNNPVWAEHYEAMALKTVIRQIVKYLPRSIEIGEAIALSENEETGKAGSYTMEGEFTVEPVATQKPEEQPVAATPPPATNLFAARVSEYAAKAGFSNIERLEAELVTASNNSYTTLNDLPNAEWAVWCEQTIDTLVKQQTPEPPATEKPKSQRKSRKKQEPAETEQANDVLANLVDEAAITETINSIDDVGELGTIHALKDQLSETLGRWLDRECQRRGRELTLPPGSVDKAMTHDEIRTALNEAETVKALSPIFKAIQLLPDSPEKESLSALLRERTADIKKAAQEE